MPILQLTPRLDCIANLVPKGARLADIGTDHGFLPLFLLLHNSIHSAIASDLRKGPLDSAKRNAEMFRCLDQLSLRLGAGLDKIEPSECDTVVIAGMGGQTIADILAAAPWTQSGGHTLLLQPMTMIPELRQYLWSHGFHIAQEVICTEGRRYYVVLRVVGSDSTSETAAPALSNCYYSDALLQNAKAHEYLTAILHRERRVLKGRIQGSSVSVCALEHQKTVVKILTELVEGKQ